MMTKAEILRNLEKFRYDDAEGRITVDDYSDCLYPYEQKGGN